MNIFLRSALTLLTGLAITACGGSSGEPAAGASGQGTPPSAGPTPAPAPDPSSSPSPDPASGSGSRWSDPATWGGTVPPANAVVVIPAGKTVILDGATPALRGLHIRGELIAGDTDTSITADYVYVDGGRLQIGTAARPYLHRATITLTGASTGDSAGTPGFGNKVLAVMGGTLELHGRPSRVNWTRLDGGDVAAGSRTIRLEQAPDWQAGDQIVIASSTGRQTDHTVATIESITGTSITLREVTRAAHTGRRHAAGDLSFDFRSEVGLLSQNIVVQGDSTSASSRIGGHAMFMAGSQGATVQIANTQFQRMGQFNQLGRYPIHFHIMGDGCRSCYVRNATVRDSIQRGIVVHDTSRVLVEGNVVYNTVGHNIVIETPTTGDNRIEGNLALMNDMPRPDFTEPTLMTQNDHLPGNYWLKSARNTFRGNVAAGSLSNGFIFDAVNTGPVVFSGNTGRNSQAEGRVGDFNFGSGVLILFNRLTHPEDDWSDNRVFHNAQGFWPENEPDEDSAGRPLQRSDSGFVIRRLTAVDNEMNVVNRGVGQRVNYVDPVIGGRISRPGPSRGFHNQYGSEVRIVNPTFVNIDTLVSATDIAVPSQSRFLFSGGGRFVGGRSSALDDTSLTTFDDDSLMPRGTYIATEQTALLSGHCTTVTAGPDSMMRCPTNRPVGELDLRAGPTSTAKLNFNQPLLRSDGLSFRSLSRPGANNVNGMHGYSVLIDPEFTYRLPVGSTTGNAMRLDLSGETFLGAASEATATVDVAVPVTARPRQVLRGADTQHPTTSGSSPMRAATDVADWHANPMSTFLYDASAGQVWVKAATRWVIVQQ